MCYVAVVDPVHAREHTDQRHDAPGLGRDWCHMQREKLEANEYHGGAPTTIEVWWTQVSRHKAHKRGGEDAGVGDIS